MRRYAQFAIFGTVFFTIIFLINFFVISSFTFLFDFSQNWVFWLIVIVSSVLYPATMLIDLMLNSRWMRPLSIISSIWLGIIIESCFVILPYNILNQFFIIDKRLAAIIIITVITGLTIYSLLASLFIHRRKIELNASKLSRERRVVQLSDLHLGSIHRINYLKRVINAVNSLEPDIVLITGDLADDTSIYQKEYLPIFKKFKAPVYMSLGNHEMYTGHNLKTLASQVNIRVLKNEVLDLGDYQLIGIDDGYTADEIGKLLRTLNYDKSKYTILMHHRPVGLEEASDEGVDLMLSGHTHQGQTFPFNFLIGLVWKRSRGLYHHGNSFLYVSSGTGTWGPPLRFGSFNEVILFTLKPGN
jgi:predicted MPP superfamily phosphohydrolase